MKCQHCGHESESGRFCSNCGGLLEHSELVQEQPKVEETVPYESMEIEQTESVNEQVELNDSTGSLTSLHTNSNQSQKEQTKKQENKSDFTDQLTLVFANFGHFFLTLVKQPTMARKANHKDLFSSLITIVAFALIVAFTLFLPHAFIAKSTWFMPAPSIFYELFMPLLLVIILLAGIASLTYVAAKITKVDFTYLDVIGKYGAYLLPYALLYLVGAVLSIGHLPFLPTILFTISIMGPIFVIPACILYEKEATGLDRIYTLLGQYFVSFLFIFLVANSLIGAFIRDVFYFLR